MRTLCSHRCGNFVVQAAVASCCSESELGGLLPEFRKCADAVVKGRKWGLVAALATAGSRVAGDGVVAQ